jgi:16S rRNA G966 N2-methylase RsmD
MGQKRRFARDFIKVLEEYPDNTTFVDLFGGSGLLSHIAKSRKPSAKVVFNDYDNYRQRLAAIPQTNSILKELREAVGGLPRNKIITGEVRERVLQCLRQHELLDGYVDYLTISTSVMFSMKYRSNLETLQRETLYNKVRLGDYPTCDGYLDGIIAVSEDYKVLFNRYRDVPGVVFLVDPPYLSTEVGSYDLYWRLSDYLDVLTVLADHPFVYFTSDKSSIIELCDWMGRHPDIGNPFANCRRVEIGAHMNYLAGYTDIMLYKPAA